MPAEISNRRMIEEIIEVSDKICSEREIDFIESAQARVKRGMPLTEKQTKWLRDIYDRACQSEY